MKGLFGLSGFLFRELDVVRYSLDEFSIHHFTHDHGTSQKVKNSSGQIILSRTTINVIGKILINLNGQYDFVKEIL